MIFVHCSKSAHAIGQSRSRVFWLPGNNESFECVITMVITIYGYQVDENIDEFYYKDQKGKQS